MGKHCREDFTDANGNWVNIGDRVMGHEVNEWLSGEVIAHNTDPQLKAFTVQGDDGKTYYMNREWTVKDVDNSPVKAGMYSAGVCCGKCGSILLGFDEEICPVCGVVVDFSDIPDGTMM